jgi:hypothetical protein
MTFHDLRATGLTWRAVRGDDALKIQRAAGHSDFQTTQGYIRTAESVDDGFGEVFPELPADLLAPESSGESSGMRGRRSRSARKQGLREVPKEGLERGAGVRACRNADENAPVRTGDHSG